MAEFHVYDDPLNPHGWAFEPTIRRLRAASYDADWRFHPTVLVPDWDAVQGPEFPRGRSSAAAVCSRVSEESGMPIDEYLWFEDPPMSSTPACRALAAVSEGAGLLDDGTTGQPNDEGDAAQRGAWHFLRACREATFLRRTNLDTVEAVVELARSIRGIDPDALSVALDEGQRVTQPDGGNASDALDPLSVSGVDAVGDRPQLPTLVVRSGELVAGVSGRVPFKRLATVLERATDEPPTPPTMDVEAVIDRFSIEGWIAPAELMSLTGASHGDVVAAARDIEGVVEREVAAEVLFRRADDLSDGESGADP